MKARSQFPGCCKSFGQTALTQLASQWKPGTPRAVEKGKRCSSHPSRCGNGSASRPRKPAPGILEALNSCGGAASQSTVAPDPKAEGRDALWAVNFYCSSASLLFLPSYYLYPLHQITRCERQEAGEPLPGTVFPLLRPLQKAFFSLPHGWCFSSHRLL